MPRTASITWSQKRPRPVGVSGDRSASTVNDHLHLLASRTFLLLMSVSPSSFAGGHDVLWSQFDSRVVLRIRFQHHLNISGQNPVKSNDIQAQIELAEMSGEDGLLASRGWPSEKPLVPPLVAIQGDALRWQHATPIGQPHRFPRRADPKGMLDSFLRIGSDKEVLRFARRWGPLYLCRHDLPYTHLLNPTYTSILDPDLSARSRYLCGPRGVEPLVTWHHFVAQARAIIEIGAALRRGQKVPRQSWEQLFQPEDGGYPEQLEAMLADSTDPRVVGGLWLFYLKPLLDLWLRWSDVHLGCSPSWIPDSSRSPLYLDTETTFGLLGVQMMAAIAGGNNIAICSACGEAYLPLRKPQRGRQNYCRKRECKRQGHRDRQRAYQARRRNV